VDQLAGLATVAGRGGWALARSSSWSPLKLGLGGVVPRLKGADRGLLRGEPGGREGLAAVEFERVALAASKEIVVPAT
jgi:hypothetical protein